MAKVEDYDLVLCDLAMPGVSGYDVIKCVNELKKRSKIGLITGWSETLNTKEAGLNIDFIAKKPFDFSELTKQINDLEF